MCSSATIALSQKDGGDTDAITPAGLVQIRLKPVEKGTERFVEGMGQMPQRIEGWVGEPALQFADPSGVDAGTLGYRFD